MVYLGSLAGCTDTKFYMTRGMHRGWVGRQKMAVGKTGVANPQVSHHNLIPADGATRDLHGSVTGFTSHSFPVLLPFGQGTSMKGSLKVQTEETRYQGVLSCGVPGSSICCFIGADTYMAWNPH
jgi:hypothetical protein